MKTKKTICILSGGLDSTTLLYRLLKDPNRHVKREVKAISFNYNQKHKIELLAAHLTCDKLGIEHKVIDVSFLKDLLSNSALTSDMPVPEGHYESESMKQTVVPNRNMIMAAIAIGYAVNEDYNEIALGVHAGDHAIYPDCRPEFVAALRKIAKIANFEPIEVYAPYLHKDKGDIVIEGTKLGVMYEYTHTCYNGEQIPCGKCGACQERAEAFAKAKRSDPLLNKSL